MTSPPRREFLLRVLAACGTPWAVAVVEADAQADAGQKPPPKPAGDTNARLASDYFGASADAARAIGEAYLRQLGVEPTRASILEHAGDALAIFGTVKGQQAVTTALVSAVRRDFQEHRVLELDGWVLSRTEVQLCVLTLLPAVN
jgi:hypothetical protein